MAKAATNNKKTTAAKKPPAKKAAAAKKAPVKTSPATKPSKPTKATTAKKSAPTKSPPKKAPLKKAAMKLPPAKAAPAPVKTGATKKVSKEPPAKTTSKKATSAPSVDKDKSPAKASKPAAKAAAKPAVPLKKGGGLRQDVDVKSAVGGHAPRPIKDEAGTGGLSFLTGKPGSSGQLGASPSDEPRLARTKLNSKELRHFRDLLLDKRRQLLGDVDSLENEALRVEQSNLSHLPVHMADQGTDNYEQEFTLSLADRDRQLIADVDHALAKIDDKTFGICEGTGQMIVTARLEAQPTARYSIEYAKTLKRPGVALRP